MNDKNNIIRHALKNDKLSHAYLFYSQKGVDIESCVFEAIKLILEEKMNLKVDEKNIEDFNYYDFKMIKPNIEGIIIKEKVNEVISSLYESSLTNNKLKILYIKDIDAGNKFSLNRLLKFVEEPTENLIIFMSTNHFDKVISTIKSRTQNVFIKQELLEEKMDKINQFCNKEFVKLLAYIYPNVKELQKIDLDLFVKTYYKLLEILDEALDNVFTLKISLNNLWEKANNEFILNIMQFFYYQILIKIDKNNPLFPGYNQLINKYKTKKIDYFKIHSLIENLKLKQKSYTNFNLQKNAFLAQLEDEYKTIIY